MRPSWRALEARGFESVWAPEHSHIPTSRRLPYQAGGELPKQYYDVMDPFVSLSAAAAGAAAIGARLIYSRSRRRASAIPPISRTECHVRQVLSKGGHRSEV